MRFVTELSRKCPNFILRAKRDAALSLARGVCEFLQKKTKIRLVAKLFEHRAKFRAPIGKCARKNATQAVRKNVRGAFGAAHIFGF